MSWSFGVIAVLLGAPLLVRGAGLAASLISAQRLVRELGGLATFDASKAAYLIPGTSCFVAGWPRGAIYLGRDLLRGLDEGGLTSVLAHERAHLRYGHVAWRVAARVLAAFHLPGVGRRLLSALDLALEQVCDQTAAREVGDPLLVAQTIVDAARLRASSAPRGALAFVSRDLVEERVRALCTPAWEAPRAEMSFALVSHLALFALGIVFDRRVHDVAEHFMELLGG